MHERPELHHIILKRRACKQESALSIEAQKGLPALALKVFDVLSLIEDHVVPLFATECKMVLDHQLIRGDADVEGVVLAPAMSLSFALLLRPEIGKDLEGGTPLLELHLPVDDDGCRNYDQMGSPHSFLAC
jgi:hypothetical protein